jgi:hypothetical protein
MLFLEMVWDWNLWFWQIELCITIVLLSLLIVPQLLFYLFDFLELFYQDSGSIKLPTNTIKNNLIEKYVVKSPPKPYNDGFQNWLKRERLAICPKTGDIVPIRTLAAQKFI